MSPDRRRPQHELLPSLAWSASGPPFIQEVFMSFISDMATILRAGITVDELKELASIQSKEPEKEKDPEPEIEEPEKEEPEKDPEPEKDGKSETQKKLEDSKDYKKLYEETRKKLKDLQKEKTMESLPDKSKDENKKILEDCFRSFM